MGLGVIKLGRINVGTVLFPTGGHVFSWRVGEEYDVCQLLCSWRSPSMNPAPVGHAVRCIDNAPSHVPQMFLKLLLLSCNSISCS